MGIAWGGVLQGVNQGAQLGMQITEAERRREREDKLAAREDQAYQEQQDLKSNVRSALQDVAPVNGEAMVNANPAVDPAKYEDPSVMNSDVRELRRGGVQAETRPATWVGNQEVQQGQAALIAGQQNTQAGQLERLSKVYAQAGQVDQAMKFRQAAEQARSEGADKFIDDAFSRAPTMDALSKGPVLAPIDMKARETFDAMGKMKIPEGAQIKYIRQDMPNGGGSFVDAQVVDKAGNPLHPGTLKQQQWILATNPVQRQQVDRQGLLDQVAKDDKQADNTRADRQVKNQEDAQKLNEWSTRERIKIDWQRMTHDTDYKNRVLQQYEDGVRGSKNAAYEKLSAPDQARVKAWDALQGKIEEQVQSTQDAINKGMIAGTFKEVNDDGSPNKEFATVNRTLKDLVSRSASIDLNRRKLLEGGTNDPVGLRKKPDDTTAPPQGREVVSKAEQAKRDADAVPILQETHAKNLQSLANAKTPEERGRAEYDVEASARELKARGVAPAGTLKSAAPASPAASAPAPAPSVAPAPAPKAEAAKPPASSLESWAKTQKAAEQARRDDPELKKLQAAVDNASGRQIHTAKKALEDYINKKGA